MVLVKMYFLERNLYVTVKHGRSECCPTLVQGYHRGTWTSLNLQGANLEARYFTFADDSVLLYSGTDKNVLN